VSHVRCENEGMRIKDYAMSTWLLASDLIPIRMDLSWPRCSCHGPLHVLPAEEIVQPAQAEAGRGLLAVGGLRGGHILRGPPRK
jgi:hypothetical protein